VWFWDAGVEYSAVALLKVGKNQKKLVFWVVSYAAME